MNHIFNPDSCQGGEGTKLCAYNVATNCNSTDGTTHMTSLRVEVSISANNIESISDTNV